MRNCSVGRGIRQEPALSGAQGLERAGRLARPGGLESVRRAVEAGARRPLLALLAAMLIAASPAAQGHAHLLGTVPAAGASLAAAPPSITLHFDSAVRLATLKLTRADQAMPIVLDRNAPPAKDVQVRLPALVPGTYEVRFSALTADDGHIVSGHFSFVLRTAAAQP